MNKLSVSLIFALSPLFSYADEVPGLLLQKSDGSQVEVEIAKIRSIRFADGNMIISHTDATLQSFPLVDIAQICFGNVTEAIQLVTLHTQNSEVTITSLSGELIYAGPAHSSDLPVLPQGTYVFTVDGVAQKVAIMSK